MKKSLMPLIVVAFFFAVLSTPSPLPAGQVVTDQLRSWAHAAAAQKTAAAKPAVPNSVAVLYFSNKTGRSDITPLQKGLPLMLSADLSRIKGLRVIERARIQALYDALGLQPSSSISADRALRLGKMLGAFYVVSASIVRGRITDLKITANCVEVPNDMLLDQPVSAGDLADLVSMEKEILFDLISAFQLDLKSDQLKRLERPVSADIDALYLLFKGIDASDRGRYETAAELYKKALRQDPQLAVASSALTELQTKVFLARAPQAPAPVPAKPATAATAPEAPAATTPATAVAVPATKSAPAQETVAAPPPNPAPPKTEAPPPAGEAPAEGAKSAPPEEKRLSTGMIVAIGIGAAAAIGGIAAAAGGGGGGGNGEAPAPSPPPQPEPPPAGPQITGVDPPAGSAVACTSATVAFTFDRDMDVTAGQIGVSIPDWQFTASFTDARTYVISWEDNCPASGDPGDLPAAITFVFANFRDTAQNPLEGDTEFTFDLTM